MAALTAIKPDRAGTLDPPGNVASSDTISISQLGSKGAILEIINGNASPDNITISDAGLTPAGSPLTGGTFAATVTNATAKSFYIRPEQADANGLVTITHSVTATVTYKLHTIP